jgi:predicted nucleic acid-binding Zn ribbon protein
MTDRQQPPESSESPAPSDPGKGIDLARAALQAAREQARKRGAQGQQRNEARRRGLRSGARPDGRDPFPLKAAIERLTAERGWDVPVAVGGVMGRWPEIVGADIAAHCEPEHYAEDDKVLTVRCDSTVWATQLRLLTPRLVAALNQELGHGTVRLITVRGPAAPRRSYGRLRAPGSRGPGDTWG